MDPDADAASDAAAELDAIVARAIERLSALDSDPGEGATRRLRQVIVASDFAADTLARQPALLERLLADDAPEPVSPPRLDAGNAAEWPALLRRYRAAESTRLVWRDVLGLDDLDATLSASTALAGTCLRLALEALHQQFAGRHGEVPGPDGSPQRLVVFGLGKLGGGELNFSSDIDLVYGYEHPGESSGPRRLDAEAWFSRLGQQLARLLGEVTAEGFCHRVDLRLRPYGTAGRVAWSFPAMEQYFQHEGRDWERYAWQKARPVAGDLAAGERLLETLRPFVYRRYLDYGALDGLRAMKAAISAEVARKELADDIKRGPGGIREIEFLVQALQLIRGGREPELRGRRLQGSLAALVEARQIEPAAGDALLAAYRFLRRLENRLQMLRDEQVHAIPDSALDRARMASGLGYPDWTTLRAALDAHRAAVSEEFAALLAPRQHRAAPDALSAYWHALPDGGGSDTLGEAGFDEPASADGLLRDFARSPGVRGLSDATRARLDRVMPPLLQGAARSSQPLLAIRRLLALLHNILRRSAYLALLDEQPAALARLIEVVGHSALLAERLAQHPLLLDELLDARVGGPLPDRDQVLDACLAVAADNDLPRPEDRHEHDVEAVLNALNEVRQSLGFRIAMATRDHRQPPADSARQLAWLADGVVTRVLALARREVVASHGDVPGARFAILGYGSLGGQEPGFGSDLDLVFLFDAPADAESTGSRTLDAGRWSARLAQKVVALLGTPSSAGRLFDVDVRLRPDGAKGLLVSSLSSFSDYQQHRAWTWEHQALVRARCVAGDATLCADFERIRATTLTRERDPAEVRRDISRMRRRMRAELDRSDAAAFDLKHGEGGLVDLEFLLQALVLQHAADHPGLLQPRDTPNLIEAAHRAGLLDDATRTAIHDAHSTLLAHGLECTLDRRVRRVPRSEDVEQAREAIRDAIRHHGLDFNGSSDTEVV